MNSNSLNLIVTRRTQEAEDIISLDLMCAEGKNLPVFKSGAHIDLHLPNGLVRQYSLCHPYNTSSANKYSIAVQREKESRGGSVAVHEQLVEGVEIQVSEPRNLFELTAGATKYVLIAGGIGITPLLCMAQELALSQQEFELHYFCRSQSRVAFTELLKSEGLEASVQLHVGANNQSEINAILKQPEQGTHLYVCGPAGFMDYVLEIASEENWPAENLHKEYFSAEILPQAGDHSFEVCLASTGERYEIPADKTVFEVLDEAGVSVPVSCEQGVCGTCVTRILEGMPDHRDQYLTDEEKAAGDSFTPCCSRAHSKTLLLDL